MMKKLIEKFKKQKKGITLIELLIVVVIISIVAVGAVMSFRSGKTTWGGADKQTEVIQNAVVGMEKVVREIKNSPRLTSISSSSIGLVVLREDSAHPGVYMEQFAMFQRDGDYLKYGERPTEPADWTPYLNNLAYPVTNLSFTCYKADGTPTTDQNDAKSVRISMTTQDGGVIVPLISTAYLVANNTASGTGAPPDFEDIFENNNDPQPGGGNGIAGCTLDDYCIYGHTGISKTGSGDVFGSVGTYSTYGGTGSSDIYGCLIVHGNFNVTGSGNVGPNPGPPIGLSVVAAGYAPSSANQITGSGKFNCDFWTYGNLGITGSAKIKGTVHHPEGTHVNITGSGSVGGDALYSSAVVNAIRTDANYNQFAFLQDLFPSKPTAVDDSAFTWNANNQTVTGSTDATFLDNTYGDITATGSGKITLNPSSGVGHYRNLQVTGSGWIEIYSGDYYFNNIQITGSKKIRSIFTQTGTNPVTGKPIVKPIRIYMMNNASITGSSTNTGFYIGGTEWTDQYEAARYIYLEPKRGISITGSGIWKGFIYCPEGEINLTGSADIYGSLISWQLVRITGSGNVTYVPPYYVDEAHQLLPLKFPIAFHPVTP